jgi:hypothetical protein
LVSVDPFPELVEVDVEPDELGGRDPDRGVRRVRRAAHRVHPAVRVVEPVGVLGRDDVPEPLTLADQLLGLGDHVRVGVGGDQPVDVVVGVDREILGVGHGGEVAFLDVTHPLRQLGGAAVGVADPAGAARRARGGTPTRGW